MLENKKNIGLLVETLKNGGAERAIANLSKDLSEQYNVYIILFDASDIAYPYCGQIVNLPYNYKQECSFLKKFVNILKAVWGLNKIKRTYDINTIVSFMPSANRLNVLAKRNARDLSIISIRNTMSRKNMGWLSKKILVWCGKKSDKTISLSDGVKTDLVEYFNYPKEKVTTIYNSCDFNWFYRENDTVEALIKKYDFSKPSLVTVGRLTYQKGQWHLLRALALVKKQIADVNLYVFGKGELEKELIIYTQKLGLSKNVHFMGYLKNHHQFMKQCDVFVFPSIYEGLGNVLLESIACGMPTISTDCPCGPREILSENSSSCENEIDYSDYGILIPPFTSKELNISDINFEKSDYLLAEAIVRVLSDNNLKEKYRNKALLRSEKFSPKNIKLQWFDLLEEAEKRK